MAFVLKHPLLLATIAVFSTAAFLLLGNGMNPLWPVMWVAPLPILLLAAELESWWVVAVAAALSMLLGSLTMLYYLHFVLHAPFAAWLVPFLLVSLLFSAGILLFRALLRRHAVVAAVIAIPSLWGVCEYLGSFAPANGTAGSLAYTQLRFLPFLQLASVTGPWGMSFLLLLFPSALAAGFHLWWTKPLQAYRLVGAVLGLLVAVMLFGIVRLARSDSRQEIKVGLLATDRVQLAEAGSPTQDLLHSYAEQAEKLGDHGAQIIVMPEKTGVLLDRDTKTVDATLQSVADRTGATLVVGLVHVVEVDSFNEARIYTPDQPVTTYNKQHMLPPFESKLKPGTSLTFLSQHAGRVGVAICKDMDFIHPALEYGRAGVALMLDPAWDFNFDGVWHGHIAIMRGVENGYAIAHTAKDGLLTATDNRGRILGEVRSNTAPFSSVLLDVPLHHDNTIFNRYGAWFPWLAGALLIATLTRLAIGVRSGPKERSAPALDNQDPRKARWRVKGEKMKYLVGLFAVAFLLSHSMSIAAEPGGNVENSVPVGVQIRHFTDESRRNWQGTGPRPLATIIWYPVAPSAPLKAPDYGTPPDFSKYFVSNPLADAAEISREVQKYPLIVMSHGSTSSALSLDWIGYYLATRGYIVAAVNHHGNTAAEPGGPLPQGFGTQWERAKDISVLIDKMLADPVFGQHIDANRIGAIGHSAGGATVIEVVGGIFSATQIQQWCKSNNGADPNCHLPPALQQQIEKFIELSKTDPVVKDSVRRSQLPYNDPRVKAAFAMAPAIGIGHTDASLEAIQIPVAIVAGWADDITPLANDAERFAKLIPTATLTVLPGKVGHATFGSLCTPAAANGPAWLNWICHDEEGVNRGQIHRDIEQLASQFFQQALGN